MRRIFAPERTDDVRIVAGAGSRTTVMIPSSVAILQTRVRGGGGIVTIDGYHGGTLFVGLLGGRASITNVMSAAFIQMMSGRLDVSDSSFDRLRARGNAADFIFEHDRARQIEVSTVSGNIVYDNGTFDPGLARFESTYGSIGLGVATNAQLSARSTDGRVYSMWERRTPIDQRSPGEASATVAGGGPVVNAVTAHGNVYLYDGAFATRHTIPNEWQPLREALALRSGSRRFTSTRRVRALPPATRT